jgi:tryptophan 2,3-dioxygenase
MTSTELESLAARDTQVPSYGQILLLDELLELAYVHDDDVDRVFFFATHQACEVWFAIVLRHLEAVRAALDKGNGVEGAERLERLPAIIAVIAEHFDVLTRLSPESFDRIRTTVGASSGVQSAQFREIEFLSGLRDARYLNIPGLSETELARMRARLAERSITDAFHSFCQLDSSDRAIVDRIRCALLKFDQSVRLWRAGHAALAEHFLHDKKGTAGTDGAAYLWQTVQRRLFPELWPDNRNQAVLVKRRGERNDCCGHND